MLDSGTPHRAFVNHMVDTFTSTVKKAVLFDIQL